MHTRFWRVALTGVCCILAASCARESSTIKADFDQPAGSGQHSNISTGRPDLTDEDLGPDVPSAGALRGTGQLARIPELGTVYFDYNSASLRGDAQDALDAHAAFLRSNRGMRVQIEGHCDERGTLEYNLALGERRAQVVRKFLVSKGIAGDRLYTISYGEERPARMGHDETTWHMNRRAEFQIAR